MTFAEKTMKANRPRLHRCHPSRACRDCQDEIAVFTLRVAEGILRKYPQPAEPACCGAMLRRRLAFIERVRNAEKHVREMKRHGNDRLAAAVARLKARDQYGNHPETGVLATD